MTDISDQEHENRPESEGESESNGGTESRRRILKLGALAVPAVATLSPNMAMATYGGGGGGTPPVGGASVSLMACTVPMPAYVDEKGFPVDEGETVERYGKLYRKTDGKWLRVYKGPPEGSYSGEQLKNSISRGNWNPPAGVQPDEFEAHVQYLYKVRYQQVNGAGLTCLISLTSNLDAYHA